jgi:hypothetical protein
MGRCSDCNFWRCPRAAKEFMRRPMLLLIVQSVHEQHLLAHCRLAWTSFMLNCWNKQSKIFIFAHHNFLPYRTTFLLSFFKLISKPYMYPQTKATNHPCSCQSLCIYAVGMRGIDFDGFCRRDNCLPTGHLHPYSCKHIVDGDAQNARKWQQDVRIDGEK